MGASRVLFALVLVVGLCLPRGASARASGGGSALASQAPGEEPAPPDQGPGAAYLPLAQGPVAVPTPSAQEPGGAGGADGPPQTLVARGQLRVVHAWVGVPAVDVLVDGAPVRTALAFGAESGYLPLPAGAHSVGVAGAGAAPDGPLLREEVEIAAGGARTLVACREPGGALLLDDLALAPVGGPALVRLVHAAEGVPTLELAAADEPRLAGPVEPGAVSAYTDVPPSALTLTARLAGDGAAVAAIPGAVLVADRSYTFVALGAAGGPLSLLGLVNE